jgi:hypothetical protein
MKPINAFRLIAGVLIVFMLSLLSPSCASSHSRSKNSQKKGLMLQDKSQYSRNKKHFKGSKAYKSQKKRMKKSGHI